MSKKPLIVEQPWHGLVHIPPYLDCRAPNQMPPLSSDPSKRFDQLANNIRTRIFGAFPHLEEEHKERIEKSRQEIMDTSAAIKNYDSDFKTFTILKSVD